MNKLQKHVEQATKTREAFWQYVLGITTFLLLIAAPILFVLEMLV